jgi:ABC-2 type transport system ATP-binding protein
MFTSEAVNEHVAMPPGAGKSVVDVADVTKRYARRTAVEKLSLDLGAGEVLGLVGANGGGKTTTLRILAGILEPDEGHGRVLGFDLVRGAKEIREHVGYMSQRFSLYGDLSVLENLRFRAEVYGLDRPRTAAEDAMSNFELTKYSRSAAKKLSGGWARRLQLAAALIHSPKLILLDEPTAGLDAASLHEVWRRIERLAGEAAGVIVSTHDLGEAERCSRLAVLSEGRVVAIGTPAEITRSAPAAAFLMSGVAARLLASSVEAVPSVIASYPQGPSLRIVAAPEAEESLRRVADRNGTNLRRVTLRLEDALLAFPNWGSVG